jgi:hypothetical protein
MKRTLYFYGSNLDAAHMRRRCPTVAPIGPATLDGWRLVLDGHSRAWGGPMATFVRAKQDRVAGVLCELTPDDLAILDRIEGRPLSDHRKLVH